MIFLLLFSYLTLYAQEDEMQFLNMNKSDSIQLLKTMNEFVKAIETKNSQILKQLSLSQIDCSFCIDIDSMDNYPDNIVPIEAFINMALSNFINSPLHKAFKKNRIRAYTLKIRNYKPRNLPKKYGEHFTRFNVTIQTYLQDEWVKGHEGQSHTFEFIKIDGKYKFYGLSSIP